MNVAFLLMFAGGMVGVMDQLYFHIYRFKLHKLQITFWEHLTHVGKDLTYLLFFLLMNARATGKWWWLYPCLSIVNVANTMTDATLEPRTRRTLGGIPAGEYRMHCFIFLMDGLAMGFVLWGAQGYRELGDGLVWSPLQLPGLLAITPAMAIMLAIGFLAHDLAYLVRGLAVRRVERAFV
jgi:hypothetical protein